MAKVAFVTGEGEEKSYQLFSHRPLRIGRDPANDIVLRDAKVSRTHAEIVFERGFFVLHDLSSANGTYVNGVRVRVAPLTEGAELKLGNSRGVFSEELVEPPRGTIAAPIDRFKTSDGEPGATAPQEMARPQQVADVLENADKPEDPPGNDRRATSLGDAAHLPPPTLADLPPTGTLEIPVTSAPPLIIPQRRTGDTLREDEKLRRHRFIIEAEAPHSILMKVRDDAETPLFWIRRHVTLITFIANVLAGVVIISGLAGTLFLAREQNILPAVVATILTFFFSVIIVSLAPRRFLHVFLDEACDHKFVSLWQESRFPFPRTRFSARSGNGTVFAVFEKLNINPFGRRRWWVRDEDGHARIGYAVEDSLVRALARKVFGNFLAVLRPDYTMFVGVRRCGFIDRSAVGDGRILLDMNDDPGFTMNRRTALALALLIGCVEK
jgi:hypothetical protein